MPNVRRRIETLERSRSWQRGPDRYQEMQRRALQRLSTEDLQLLEDLIAQGRWEGELTEQESAAAKAFISLFDLFPYSIRKYNAPAIAQWPSSTDHAVAGREMKLRTRIERMEERKAVGKLSELTIASFDSVLDGTTNSLHAMFRRYTRFSPTTCAPRRTLRYCVKPWVRRSWTRRSR